MLLRVSAMQRRARRSSWRRGWYPTSGRWSGLCRSGWAATSGWTGRSGSNWWWSTCWVWRTFGWPTTWPTRGWTGRGGLSRAALGRRLLETSSEILLALFERASPFWDRYTTYLDQWRQAGKSEDAWRGGPHVRLVDDWRFLAWRGAPAKITATGVCLLAGRAAVIAPLETCIDHIMAATVLLDHADDWQEDLPAGRFNAYVAWLSDTPQQASTADRNRRVGAVSADAGRRRRAPFVFWPDRPASGAGTAGWRSGRVGRAVRVHRGVSSDRSGTGCRPTGGGPPNFSGRTGRPAGRLGRLSAPSAIFCHPRFSYPTLQEVIHGIPRTHRTLAGPRLVG